MRDNMRTLRMVSELAILSRKSSRNSRTQLSLPTITSANWPDKKHLSSLVLLCHKNNNTDIACLHIMRISRHRARSNGRTKAV